METNRVPPTDRRDNPTGCCPRFRPQGWDEQALHFEHKPFVRAISHGVQHVPHDMAPAYAAAASAIERANAWEDQQLLVLNRVLPAQEAEHLFAVRRPVPGMELVELDGDYRTKLFEGPYEQAPHWQAEFERELAEQRLIVQQIYFYFTTCPACAEYYGRNYVVAVAKLRS